MRSSLTSSKRGPQGLSALPAMERAVVELLSVFSDGEPLTNITRALGKVGQRIKGRSPKNDEVLPMLHGLAARGFVVGDGRFSLAPAVSQAAARSAAREGRFERMAEIVRELRPAYRSTGAAIASWALAIRELRIEMHTKRWAQVRSLQQELPRHIFHGVCSPFDGEWLAEMPADVRAHALAGIVEATTAHLEPATEALALLEREPALTDGEHRILVEKLVLSGRLDDAEQRLAGRTSAEADVGRAWLAFLHGRTTDAIQKYEAALKVVQKMGGKRAPFFPDRPGLFFIVALIADGTTASWKRAADLARAAMRATSLPLQDGHGMLAEALDVLAHRREPEDDSLVYITSRIDVARRDPLELLLQVAAARWIRFESPREVTAELERRVALASDAGLLWYAAQGRDLLGSSEMDPQVAGVRLATLVSPRERWMEALDALSAIAAPREPSPASAARPGHAPGVRRLAWIVRNERWGIALEPREQTWKGAWSKGKPVALKRLFADAKQLGFLSATDVTACGAIESETTYEYYGRYPRVHYSIDVPRALRALAASDNLLIEVAGGDFQPCEVRAAEPRLEVARDGARLALTLVPRPANDEEGLSVVVSGPRTIELVEFAPIHHAIGKALGTKPLLVPSAGEAKLRAVVAALSGHLAVSAELAPHTDDTKSAGGGDDDGAITSVRGDARPCFVLRVLGDALSVSAHVRPLGASGPLVRPGQGGAALLARVDGARVRATRDLDEEARRFERALAASPALTRRRSEGADFLLPDRENALSALVELRALGDDVVIEWPDGAEQLQVSQAVSLEELRVAITRDAEGFLVRGGLLVADGKMVELAELIDYLSASPGRFLRLGDDPRYVALSAELRARLDDLRGIGARAGDALRIDPLAAPLVADLLASSQVEADAAWQQQVDRFKVEGAEATVSTTLRAELRPYQLDGFRWLARLSHWGAGGCLADDMGLGKTLQALALLLHRAPEGPALVVAPTSVVSVWVDEIARFAPTLRVRTFAGPARAEDLKDLGPFDLVVTSYRLLQVDIESLAKIDLATVVLDEAQMIKNADTKTAAAARRLRAKLRVATTGTPIENRLEDLRSIFAFINPGLLGSPQSFEARFVRPIERARDAGARDWLRRLVAPFVLRRTKTEVLPELPARTEVTLRVPLEVEETALYEAIRSEALAALAGKAAPGRMQLLAAIMRLRLAASNARLVLPESKASSAKLAALADILDELLPNGHKLLVFSQFVGHLALVKELLHERKVSHQYLDGSTPAAARKKAVDRFQAGEGDVFLISLKAGGFGLNLTAADYVVHMDPWWNPAAEDQASDSRAPHRSVSAGDHLSPGRARHD